MERIPETELMDDEAQARAYAEEDFSEANTLFMEQFDALHPGPVSGLALDLGCGPADITLRFARAYPNSRIDGLDGAEAMLNHGRLALRSEPALQARVRLIQDRLPGEKLGATRYDHLLSNSLLHHLADPSLLWEAIRRFGKPGATVLIMDLFRPDAPATVERLVESYAGGAPEILRRDFRNSLFAAFTPEEVVHQVRQAGLSELRVNRVSDRHLLVRGYL